MDLARLLLSQAALWALATCRLGGFVLTSPFPGENVPTSQRVGLVVVLAWAASVNAPTAHLPAGIGAALLGSAAFEVAIGVLLGVTFRFVYAAAEVLGQSLAQGTGLSSPGVFNPTLGTSDTPIGRMVTLLAMLLALAMGAHRVALGAVLSSFHALPLGAGADLGAAAGPLVNLAANTIAVGVRLSLPVTAVALVVQLALAMIARAAPSLQIFNVGLGITLGAGAAVLLTVLPDLGLGLGDHFDSLRAWMDQVLSAVAVHDIASAASTAASAAASP